MHDSELLREYLEKGSDRAFARLVERYINLVFATAQRWVLDPQHAEEIAQSVFWLLAEKARNLIDEVTLADWLYRTTRITAQRACRHDHRRNAGRTPAVFHATDATARAAWKQISPLLDEALERLSDDARRAVLLHFFQQKSLRELDDFIDLSEDSAGKTVGNALEQIRQMLSQQGVTCSVTFLDALLSEKCIGAARATLAAEITAVSSLAPAAKRSVRSSLKLFGSLKNKETLPSIFRN